MGKSLGIPIGAADAVANLLSWANVATPEEWRQGAEWYPNAMREALALGIGLEHGAAVIAATSPRTYWAQNLEHARAIVSGDDIPAGSLHTNDVRGRHALYAGLAGLGNGPKVNAFARNIMGEYTPVTVDTWAIRALVGDSDMGITNDALLKRMGGYEWASAAYRTAAGILSTPPAVLQAVVWVAIRGRAE